MSGGKSTQTTVKIRQASSEFVAQGVAVIGSIREKDLTRAESGQHIGGALAVVGLALGQFQRDRQAVGVDQHMDFRG